MSTKVIGRGFIKAPSHPLIPEGTYSALLLKADICFAFGYKVVIQFNVPYQGKEVILSFFANVSIDKESQLMVQPKPSMKLGVALQRLLPDTPLKEINLDLIEGLKCLVRVKTAKTNGDRKEKPKTEWYSVVEEVLKSLQDEDGYEEDDIPS